MFPVSSNRRTSLFSASLASLRFRAKGRQRESSMQGTSQNLSSGFTGDTFSVSHTEPQTTKHSKYQISLTESDDYSMIAKDLVQMMDPSIDTSLLPTPRNRAYTAQSASRPSVPSSPISSSRGQSHMAITALGPQNASSPPQPLVRRPSQSPQATSDPTIKTQQPHLPMFIHSLAIPQPHKRKVTSSRRARPHHPNPSQMSGTRLNHPVVFDFEESSRNYSNSCTQPSISSRVIDSIVRRHNRFLFLSLPFYPLSKIHKKKTSFVNNRSTNSWQRPAYSMELCLVF